MERPLTRTEGLLDRINRDLDRLEELEDDLQQRTLRSLSPFSHESALHMAPVEPQVVERHTVTAPVSPPREEYSYPPAAEHEPPPSSRNRGASTLPVQIEGTGLLVAMLARAYKSSDLCDVRFVLRSGATSEVDRVDAMGAVVAAQSPSLKALIYGDYRAGWFGASTPTGMRTEKADVTIDLPENGWSSDAFRLLVRFCHTGQVALTPGAEATLGLALCANHCAVDGLRDLCVSFIAQRLPAFEHLLASFYQSIAGVDGFTELVRPASLFSFAFSFAFSKFRARFSRHTFRCVLESCSLKKSAAGGGRAAAHLRERHRNAWARPGCDALRRAAV